MSESEQLLRYSGPSAFDVQGGERRLRLTAASDAPGLLFEGRISRPQVGARMLGAISLLVTSRFHVPGSALIKVLDPVVTVGRYDVRFEAFSGCAGVHALAVFGPGAHDGGIRSVGTTNVDFGDDMRAALAGVRDGDGLLLTIGADAVAVESAGTSVVERRVPLPERWLRSFLELQAIQAALPFALEVPGPVAVRFFRSLSRHGSSGRAAWIVPTGDSLRISARPQPAALRTAGPRRLRVLEQLSHDATNVRFFGGPEAPALGIELDLGDRRFVLTLSAEVWRGFSGEGTTLEDLTSAETVMDGRVLAALRFGETVDPSEVAAELGCDAAVVRSALARLGRTGAVGYDLGVGAYYRRELPFEASRLARLQPRLERARELVEDSAVTARAEEPDVFDVRGRDVVHRVVLSGVDGFACTCPWHARHAGARGPCAHVLAARIVRSGS